MRQRLAGIMQPCEWRKHFFHAASLWGFGMLLLLATPPAIWALPDDDAPTVMIPDVLIHAQADGGEPAAVLVVDKRHQLIRSYVFESVWIEKRRWPCSTGKSAGPKESEGDQRTPEGLYFISRHVQQRYLSETYGTRALILDYPNGLDRMLGRGGSNIWLHGTNKPLRARDSNGCVVMQNGHIDELAELIQLRRTPVIIVDGLEWWPQSEAAEHAAALLVKVQGWHAALLGDEYDRLGEWYANEAVPSAEWWQTWCRLRRDLAVESAALTSEMRNAALYRHQGTMVLLFDHYLNTAQQSVAAGRRKLSLAMMNHRVRILEDIYLDSYGEAGRGEEPLFAAWRCLWQSGDGIRTSHTTTDLEDHDT